MPFIWPSRIRAAVIVVTPMPSPKRMTFFAFFRFGLMRALVSTSARPRAKKVSLVSTGVWARAGKVRIAQRSAARARLRRVFMPGRLPHSLDRHHVSRRVGREPGGVHGLQGGR